jgi:hypothetical protein
MDIASVHRIAASCARQSYKPLFVWPYTAHIPSDHKDPNVEGGVMPAGWFPDMKADTPATAEYQAAFQKFLGGERAAGHSGGWAAGKMFERASSRVPDPTTSAGILEGLWTSFNGETLGGLTMPLTFVRERAVPKVTCWTNVVIKGGAYEMPSNGVLKCA